MGIHAGGAVAEHRSLIRAITAGHARLFLLHLRKQQEHADRTVWQPARPLHCDDGHAMYERGHERQHDQRSAVGPEFHQVINAVPDHVKPGEHGHKPQQHQAHNGQIRMLRILERSRHRQAYAAADRDIKSKQAQYEYEHTAARQIFSAFCNSAAPDADREFQCRPHDPARALPQGGVPFPSVCARGG